MMQPTKLHPIMWGLMRDVTYSGLALFAIVLLLSEPMGEVCARPLWSVQASVGTSSAGQGDKDVRPLEPSKPIERELAGGEAHSYQVTLTAGQYLHLVVEQRGINVVLALRGPDGVPLAEMDGLSGLTGTEELVWEAASSGSYVLEVRARARQAKQGRYEVRLQMAAGAGGRERARIAAQQLFMEGRQGQAERSGAGLERRIKKYEEAVVKWREAGEQKWEGLTLHNLGNVYWSLSQYEKARDSFEQALAIWRQIKDRTSEGRTLNNLGRVYYDLRPFEKAREYLEQSLAIRREIKDRSGEGWTLHYLGDVHRNLRQYENAREHYEQALAIWHEIKDRTGEGASLRGVGHVYYYLRQYEEARDHYEQALAIWCEIKDRSNEADTLHQLGLVYNNLGQYEASCDYYERALAIRREVKDRFGEELTLAGLGGVYERLSQYQKAREYFEQALAISREIEDRQGEGWILTHLGLIYSDLGQYKKAREQLEQALAIRREIKDRWGEGLTLNSLGNLYQRVSQYEKAHEHLEQALVIRRETKNRSGEGETLYGIGRVELARGKLSEARSHIEGALKIIESLRTSIASKELRSSYFASVQDYYGLYIDLLMRLHKQRPAEGHDAAALQASEHARARSLLELLTEARANIRQGADPALLERKSTLQQQLNAQAAAQMRLFGVRHTPEQAAAVEKEIEALTIEFQKLQAQIRTTSPRYAALTQPEPLSLKEIQQQVLDPDTMLLEYSLGEKHSYLWAVTQASISSYQLPNRKKLETAARRVYSLLTLAQPSHGQTARQREARYWRQAAPLSQMLLGPVASQLGKKRLLIVADGVLQFVPFAALPRPLSLVTGHLSLAQEQRPQTKDQGPRTKDQIPLIVDHEIVSLPSASVLAVLRREIATRRPADKLVAVLADPVFERDDPRIKSDGKRQASSVTDRSSDDLKRALRDFAPAGGELELSRLFGSEQEAKAIMAVAPAREALIALGFKANRATATDPQMSQYRILHFATHGLISSEHPELSGIVLSLFDEEGQQQDGFFRLHEIYNLNLPAELVVLSACNTALGKQIKGEGIIGLTRGFMYAGAARVMASLWKVDDQATAELIKRFYQKMLREGMPASAALRAAQVEMSQHKLWKGPYNWAGFVLQGEWK